jgi:hypothetical protein
MSALGTVDGQIQGAVQEWPKQRYVVCSFRFKERRCEDLSAKPAKRNCRLEHILAQPKNGRERT